MGVHFTRLGGWDCGHGTRRRCRVTVLELVSKFEVNAEIRHGLNVLIAEPASGSRVDPRVDTE